MRRLDDNMDIHSVSLDDEMDIHLDSLALSIVGKYFGEVGEVFT
jgi:hypothetical protein